MVQATRRGYVGSDGIPKIDQVQGVTFFWCLNTSNNPPPILSILTMDSFVATHPFPSYKEMQAAIERHPDVAMSMAMWAEFGKAHYAALKDAYESAMDPAVIRKAGQIMHDLGGFRAMQMNLYVFMHFSPFRLSDDPDILDAYKQLEYKWDGVGDWVA